MRKTCVVWLVLVFLTSVRSAWARTEIIDYSYFTRKASCVFLGTGQLQNNVATFSVKQVLKGVQSDPVIFEWDSSTPPRTEFERVSSLAPSLPKGGEVIVFLNPIIDAGEVTYELLIATEDIQNVSRQVRDLEKLDAIQSPKLRCEFLVRLVRPTSPSRWFAIRELEQNYAKPEFVETIEYLNDKSTMHQYCSVLRETPGQAAIDRLAKLLESNDVQVLHTAMSSLVHKESERTPISKLIANLITHSDPEIRSAAIQLSEMRDYDEATLKVYEALTDENPLVREVAAAWPWYRHAKDYPETISKLRELADDKNNNVRLAAAQALVSTNDVDSFYSLWGMSVTNNTEYSRRSIHLDLLIESNPIKAGAMLLWPTFAVLTIVTWRRKQHDRKCNLFVIGVGVLGGFILGAILGFLMGRYHTGNPLIQSVFLMPSIVVPIALLFSMISMKCKCASEVLQDSEGPKTSPVS
ncbi:MAG: hypothetical protein CMJ78_16785 [Planctomycetaceae bacterium]|nr:hypothetical protein [Planctomycetaceae bacterium]